MNPKDYFSIAAGALPIGDLLVAIIGAWLAFKFGRALGRTDRKHVTLLKLAAAVDRTIFEVHKVEHVTNFARDTYNSISGPLFEYCAYIDRITAERLVVSLNIFVTRDVSDNRTARQNLVAPLLAIKKTIGVHGGSQLSSQ